MSHNIDRESANFDPLRNPDLFGVDQDDGDLPHKSDAAVAEERDIDDTFDDKEEVSNKNSKDLFANVNVGKVTNLFGDMSVEPVIIAKKKTKKKKEEEEEEEEPIEAIPSNKTYDDTENLFSKPTGKVVAKSLFDDDEEEEDSRDLGNVYIPKEAMEKRTGSSEQVEDLDDDLFNMPSDESLNKFEKSSKRNMKKKQDIIEGKEATKGSVEEDLDDDLFSFGKNMGTADTGDNTGFDITSYIEQNSSSNNVDLFG